jgi:carboxymethylenebutenolidase
VPGLSAAVSFYGIPPADKVDYAKANIPVQMHVAKKDGWVTPEKAEEVRKQLKDVELHLYDADHAFVNETRPEVYDEKAAKLAWERSVAFFKKHLA